MEQKKKGVSIWLEKKQIEYIHELALKNNRSFSNQINVIIEEYKKIKKEN